MGYTAVASLSHELETLLDLVRKGGRTVDARLMDLLFRAADLLERAIESAVSGVDAVDVTPMVAQLQAEAVRGGTPAYSSLAVTSEFAIERTSEFSTALTSEFPIAVDERVRHSRRRCVDGAGADGCRSAGARSSHRGHAAQGGPRVPRRRSGEEAGSRRRRVAGDRAAPGRRVRERLRVQAHDRPDGRGRDRRTATRRRRRRGARGRGCDDGGGAGEVREWRRGGHERQWREQRIVERRRAPAAQRPDRSAPARQPDESDRRAGDHARTPGAAHGSDRRRVARRDDRADVAARGRPAGRDHDEPHGARLAGVRPLPAARPRRGEIGRQGGGLHDRREGGRARPLDARRGR